MFSVFQTLAAAALCATVANAAAAQHWVPPAPCAACSSPSYVGASNATLPKSSIVPGKSFSRFIQIWLENTNYAVAASSPTFQKLAKQGITLSSYLALTHPSEPNYVASLSGDFFGMNDDEFYNIPQNISTIIDLLEAKNVSFATYQENMPYTAFPADFTQKNYITGNGSYTYYKRKHSPLGIHNSVTNISSRAATIRNFNDFAADLNASALPQWSFITPNLVNDAHDTTIDFVSQWLEFWLVPLLQNPNFNSGNGTDGTLVLLTFDENEDYTTRNNVFSLLLGSAVPTSLYNTTDDTLYSHYSTLSTVEGNWNLGNLGRGDTNKTMANVFDFVAKAINYTNTQTPHSKEPLTNLTGIFPGPLNPKAWIPYTLPTNVTRFGGSTHYRPGLDYTLTPEAVAKIKPIAFANVSSVPSWGTGNITYPTPLFGSVANGSTSSSGNGSTSSSGGNGTSSGSGSKSGAARIDASSLMGAVVLFAMGVGSLVV